MMEWLNSSINLLRGHFLFVNNKMTEDDVCERIRWLKENYLKEIATDESGWITLYQDPEDKRYWELSYPFSEKHGGGEPQLEVISDDEAKQKYKF